MWRTATHGNKGLLAFVDLGRPGIVESLVELPQGLGSSTTPAPIILLWVDLLYEVEPLHPPGFGIEFVDFASAVHRAATRTTKSRSSPPCQAAQESHAYVSSQTQCVFLVGMVPTGGSRFRQLRYVSSVGTKFRLSYETIARLERVHGVDLVTKKHPFWRCVV